MIQLMENKITNYKDISELNLDGVDILIDASGQKTDLNKLRNLKVDKIILTHPQKDADINIVLGVNEEKIDLKNHKIIATSTCNATALLPALNLSEEKKEII